MMKAYYLGGGTLVRLTPLGTPLDGLVNLYEKFLFIKSLNVFCDLGGLYAAEDILETSCLVA